MRTLFGVVVKREKKAAYLIAITITSLGGGIHQRREPTDWVWVDRGSSESGVRLKGHAGARERLCAWLVGFLPVDACFAALVVYLAFNYQRDMLVSGTYSRQWDGALAVGEVLLGLCYMAILAQKFKHVLS